MWAAVSGTGIFRSSDAGATWTASNSGLSGAWIEGLEGSPRGGTLWVRASVGLYRRDAAGAWNEVQSPFADGKEADPGLFVDRRSPGVVWAFDGAKLWRSADEGKSWAEMKLKELKMRDLMKGKTAQAQFRSFTQDPGDPKVLYAGAWSSNEPGLAVSKSGDAGVNWKPAGQGLPGEAVDELLSEAPGVVYARIYDGLCTLFVQHTSASLVIQENADPSARRDLERWLARLVPEGDPLFTHDAEGPDDMPAHVRAALTATSLSIPVLGGRLGLGAWQGTLRISATVRLRLSL